VIPDLEEQVMLIYAELPDLYIMNLTQMPVLAMFKATPRPITNFPIRNIKYEPALDIKPQVHQTLIAAEEEYVKYFANGDIAALKFAVRIYVKT
jgi:hypothetical protein